METQILSIQKTGGRSKVFPFLLTFRIAGKNLHNYLVDYGAMENIMPLEIWKQLGLPITKSPTRVTQLDKLEVKVIGMLSGVHVQIALEPRIVQYLDIQEVDIPISYGIVLSKEWSKDLNGYIATNWSHLWLPWRGVTNQIRVNSEPRLKEMITDYNNLNETVFTEVEMGVLSPQIKDAPNEVHLDMEPVKLKIKANPPKAIFKSHQLASTSKKKQWTIKVTNQASKCLMDKVSPSPNDGVHSEHFFPP